MTPPLLRFDFRDATGRARPIRFADPVRVVVARSLDEVGPVMRSVEEARRQGQFAAGFVSYEAAPAFDRALVAQPASSLPLVWFGLFDAPQPVDPSGDTLEADVDAPEWRHRLQDDEYRRAIVAVRHAIAAGDSYQVNYTFSLETTLDVATLEQRYLRLIADQRPPYAAWLDLGDWRILSLSPELFFSIRDRHIVTRPMKGTSRRGLWSDDDTARARALAASEKERAENVMIVDLARNDVTRVAEIGSVVATSLFEIERYPSVLQMVSTVEGRLRPDVTLAEIFAALFPAGSITGAPKTSSMRLIRDLESSPRGLYCGTIGYVTPAGDATFNVAIRTAVTDARSGHATYGVGGGITWDSDVDAEQAEALSKAGFLSPQPRFDLLETMRADRGRLARLDRHLDRLFASATYFGFKADEGEIRDALAVHLEPYADEGRRVRLLVARDGDVTVESAPLPGPPTAPVLVQLARSPVTAVDRFLHHKTTHRAVYESRLTACPGVFDVLLWNEAGQLTEFTIGNLVVDIDGVLWTPPRECGLLGGVFRAELLDSGQARERILTPGDLADASRVWLVNSVREWVPVTLA